MIPNCDLSRENLSAEFSTRSDINQHVKQTLEISDLESKEILISKNKGLCNELILIFEPRREKTGFLHMRKQRHPHLSKFEISSL